jgi:phenylalanyl-tRNA synthetase alpha chain
VQKIIEQLRIQFSKDLDAVSETSELDTLKIKYLGKKGAVQDLMKALKDATPEQRPEFGKVINDFKVEVTEKIDTRQAILIKKEEQNKLANEKIDVTLPGRRRFSGRKHIISQGLDEIIDILIGMGFSVQYGPDIETDYYNFEALNISEDHPARGMQDTFYITKDVLLRTQTTNIQARIMEIEKPPIRIIAAGKVYRNESISARSHVIFHQIDAFYVDKDVTFVDLLSTMDEFLKKLFRPDIETRFRPSYFPFTEPSMEVDIRCLNCQGKGCPLCKQTGWLEVAGAGMVHPDVLKNGGIDPEVYTGYAWGMGVERLLMLKYGINDIRLFTENDTRFLSQFSGL